MLSREADNLYWMSRYLERAEHGARLIDVHFTLDLDQSPSNAQRRWRRLATSLQVPPPPEPVEVKSLLNTLTLDAENPNSIRNAVGHSRENARQVRGQISTEMWEQLNTLYLALHESQLDEIWNGQPHAFFRAIKEGSQLFQGIADATVSRDEGWQFIQIGRYLERASSVVELIAAHDAQFPLPRSEQESLNTEDYLEWIGLLKCCTAYEAYCRRFTADLIPARMVEFLLLDGAFPHSLRFCVDALAGALDTIDHMTGRREPRRLERLAGRLQAALRYGQMDELSDGDLHPFLEQTRSQLELIHDALFESYVRYPFERELAG